MGTHPYTRLYVDTLITKVIGKTYIVQVVILKVISFKFGLTQPNGSDLVLHPNDLSRDRSDLDEISMRLGGFGISMRPGGFDLPVTKPSPLPSQPISWQVILSVE